MRRSANRTSVRLTAAIVLGSAAIATAYGQDSTGEPLYVDLGQCVGIDSDERRHACFQQRFDAALTARDAGARREAEPARPPAVTEAPRPRNEDRTPARTEETEADEIVSTIAELQEIGRDRWVITLANGQVWQTSQAVRFPLRVDLEVRLKPTNWGPAYRLTAVEYGRNVQVRQIR